MEVFNFMTDKSMTKLNTHDGHTIPETGECLVLKHSVISLAAVS